MPQILIDCHEYTKAYNAAAEYVMKEWPVISREEDFDKWAGDVLSDFLDKFLETLNIYEADEG